MKSKRITAVWIFGVALWAMQSQAAQLGPYIGGGYGLTEKDDDGSGYESFVLGRFYPELAFTPITHDVSFDTEDQGYVFLAGYRAHRHLAIEGMFTHHGSVEYRAVSDGTVNLFLEDGSQAPFPLTVQTNAQSSLSGLGLYALGILPVGRRWEFYARGGVQFSTIRTEVWAVRTAGTERIYRAEAGIARDSTVDAVVGAGIALSLFDIYGARLEYTRVINAGGDLLAEGDADMLSLGFIVAF